MKKFFALALALIMVLSLVACGGSKKEEAKEEPKEETTTETTEATEPTFTGDYLMGTGGATGNYYAFGNALSTVVNGVLGCNITVNSTGGSTENARLLGSRENEFALIQSDVYSYAQQGIELFDGNAIDSFQAITACYPEMVQIVVRKDSGIKSVADMAGRNICVGDVGSGYEVRVGDEIFVRGPGYLGSGEVWAIERRK